MGASGNTSRQPFGFRNQTKRDLRSVLASNRTAEADLRKALYVRPLGLGYHVVRNLCNDQEYVVADSTGGRTYTGGAVVSLGSFSGHPGDFLTGDPPAGMGGNAGFQMRSHSYSLTMPAQPAFDGTETFKQFSFAWDSATDSALVARIRTRTAAGMLSEDSLDVQIVRIQKSDIPVSDFGVGDVVATYGLDYADRLYASSPLVVPSPGGGFMLWTMGTASGNVIPTKVTALGAAGQLLGEQSENVGTVAGWADYAISGGAIYALEPSLGETPVAGPPFDPGFRVTKRSPTSGAVLASYVFPPPATGRTNSPHTIVANGGGIRIYYSHVNGSFVGSEKYVDLDSALSPGSEVNCPFGDSPTYLSPAGGTQRGDGKVVALSRDDTHDNVVAILDGGTFDGYLLDADITEPGSWQLKLSNAGDAIMMDQTGPRLLFMVTAGGVLVEP